MVQVEDSVLCRDVSTQISVYLRASQHRAIRTGKSNTVKRPTEAVPSLASYMGECDADILDDALVDTYPEKTDLEDMLRTLAIRRGKTISRIQDLIHNEFGRRWQVRPFGSTCYGAGRFNSDLDLCIFVSIVDALND